MLLEFPSHATNGANITLLANGIASQKAKSVLWYHGYNVQEILYEVW